MRLSSETSIIIAKKPGKALVFNPWLTLAFKTIELGIEAQSVSQACSCFGAATGDVSSGIINYSKLIALFL